MKGLRRRNGPGAANRSRELGFALLMLPWIVYLGLSYMSNREGRNARLGPRQAAATPEPNDAIYFDGNSFHGPVGNFNPGAPTVAPQFKVEIRDNYTFLMNFAIAKSNFEYYEAVTLTTHATPELLKHVGPLSDRWDGPLSVAVFVPGDDFTTSVNEIARLRLCKPSVRDRATFHLFFPNAHHPPSDAVLNFTDSEGNCPEPTKPSGSSYRQKTSMAYPINVGRNLARLNALTEHVLASDIELYPSHGVMGAFIKLLAEDDRKAKDRVVYVLPIFEVEAGADPPSNKSQLVDLYRRKKAVFFHKHVCAFCNAIPKLNAWLTAKPKPTSQLGVYLTIKRHKPFNRWEPIYIGTQKEPLYDERLTWEGQQDKMSQMYELCLMDYDLAILDNAFLVHAPGIKRRNATAYELKAPFIRQNNKMYGKILAALHQKYGKKKACN